MKYRILDPETLYFIISTLNQLDIDPIRNKILLIKVLPLKVKNYVIKIILSNYDSIKIILTEPNKLLRQISQPVEKVGENEQKLMDDMLETMYAANGIGLAAIQIGVPKRIIVMDISKDKKNKKSYVFCKSNYS